MTEQTDGRESHVRSILSILSKYGLHFTQHEIAAEIADWLATHDANKEAEIKRLLTERDDAIDDFHLSHGFTWQDECERLRGIISEAVCIKDENIQESYRGQVASMLAILAKAARR